jgi:hypothetical protein
MENKVAALTSIYPGDLWLITFGEILGSAIAPFPPKFSLNIFTEYEVTGCI